MKIDHTTGGATSLPLNPKSRAAVPAARPAEAPAPADNVRQLPGRTDGSFDAARVAAIREDIRAGRYRVDPERIADGMIASLGDLLASPTP